MQRYILFRSVETGAAHEYEAQCLRMPGDLPGAGLFVNKAVPAVVFWSFFFQAEDGIRDDLVTGVQTCALPILHTPEVLVRIAVRSSLAANAVLRCGKNVASQRVR